MSLAEIQLTAVKRFEMPSKLLTSHSVPLPSALVTRQMDHTDQKHFALPPAAQSIVKAVDSAIPVFPIDISRIVGEYSDTPCASRPARRRSCPRLTTRI